MFEIQFVDTVGYIIRESGGTMLPMVFTTYEAAATQKRFLDAAASIVKQPVDRRESGDLEYPRQPRQWRAR